MVLPPAIGRRRREGIRVAQPPDRDQSWAREPASRRGLGFTDLSESTHLRYRLDGDLGPAGGRRPWTCSVNRAFLADGGAESWVEWTCPSLLARPGGHDLVASFGGGGGLGASGDGVVDVAVVGLRAATSFLRGRRRPEADQVVTDVLTVCDVSDPDGVLVGEARHRFAHWPVVDAPLPEWARTVRKVMGARQLPADAPPDGLALSMTSHSPLTIVTRDWWQLPERLEHQFDLGVALARSVVAAGAHA
jgi:hypothetical protein